MNVLEARALHIYTAVFSRRGYDMLVSGEFILDDPDQSLISLEPPRCSHCNGFIRPGVVWFGEAMPHI